MTTDGPPPTVVPLGRRAVLGRLAAAALALSGLPGPLRAAPAGAARRADHPEPRPGITAERVLPPADVPRSARRAYDAAREIPQLLDGLHCHCECAARDGLRSLLSCFETRMPINCGICRESAELALRLHREGRTLGEIRRAVDEEFA